MEVIYRLKTETEELLALMKQLKNGYPDKEIEIRVQEVEDETAYLLKNEANRQHLLEAIEEIRQGKSCHTMTMEELESMLS